MATKKKVMVDDSVKVVKPVHQPKLREEREDDDRVLPRYTVEDEEEEVDIVDTEYVESPEEMKKRILDIFNEMFAKSEKKAKEKVKMPNNVYLRDAEEDDESVLDRIVVEHTLEEAIDFDMEYEEIGMYLDADDVIITMIDNKVEYITGRAYIKYIMNKMLTYTFAKTVNRELSMLPVPTIKGIHLGKMVVEYVTEGHILSIDLMNETINKEKRT